MTDNIIVTNDTITASKKMSKMDFCFENNGIAFETFWCRVASNSCDTWNYKEHAHSFYEIHLGVQGECLFDVCGERIVLSKNVFFIVPPKVRHTIIKPSDNFSKFVWGFNVSSANCNNIIDAFKSSCEKIKSYPIEDDMINFIRIILLNALKNQFGSYEIMKNQLSSLFISFVRAVTKPVPSDVITPPAEKYDSRIEPIKKFIYDNISNKLTVQDISRQFNISERQLSRMALSSCDMTIGELKRTLQTKYIRKLLTTSDLSLKEIAEKSGFYDEYSMSKVFKRMEGMSPGKFRCSLKE